MVEAEWHAALRRYARKSMESKQEVLALVM
jgi:hypothetical protein